MPSDPKPTPLTAEQQVALVAGMRDKLREIATNAWQQLGTYADSVVALCDSHADQQARIAELEAEMGHAAYVLADAKLNPPGRIAELERENEALRTEARLGWSSARSLAIQYSAGATERRADEALAKLAARAAAEKEPGDEAKRKAKP